MCHYCGEAVSTDRKIGFGETCTVCGADMHVCALCSFYSPGLHWDCRESVDSFVADKEKRNFCEWFHVDPRFSIKSEGRVDVRNKVDSAKSVFESLFKT